MNCPRCTRDTRVTKSMALTGRVSRERTCECGITFFTEEKYHRKTVRLTVGVFRRAVTPEMKAAVLERSGHRCHYCGTPDRLGVDHVVPIAAPVPDNVSREAETNYRNSIANMVACCPACNSAKGDSLNWGNRRVAPLQQEIPGKGEEISPDPIRSDLPSLGASGSGARPRVRGKAREYSESFEVAWKQYGRKEEKDKAYEAWKRGASEMGGEEILLPLILAALKWQGPMWAPDGWKYAPYFERYVKRRRWEDEPAPAPNGSYRNPQVGWAPPSATHVKGPQEF